MKTAVNLKGRRESGETSEKIVYLAQPSYRKTKRKTKEKNPGKTLAHPTSSPQWTTPQCSLEKEKDPPQTTTTPSKTNLTPPKNCRKSPSPQLSLLSHLPGCSPVQDPKTDSHQIHPKKPNVHHSSHSASSIPNSEELLGVALCFVETEELSTDIQLRRTLKPLLNFKKIKDKNISNPYLFRGALWGPSLFVWLPTCGISKRKPVKWTRLVELEHPTKENHVFLHRVGPHLCAPLFL